MHWFTGEIFLGRELLCLFVLSENSCDLYNTVGKHQFCLGHKKKSLVLPSGLSNFFKSRGCWLGSTWLSGGNAEAYEADW